MYGNRLVPIIVLEILPFIHTFSLSLANYLDVIYLEVCCFTTKALVLMLIQQLQMLKMAAEKHIPTMSCKGHYQMDIIALELDVSTSSLIASMTHPLNFLPIIQPHPLRYYSSPISKMHAHYSSPTP